NSAGSQNITFSGSEITDTVRSTNTQGDGRATPDSSTGIWDGTTNTITNGGLETNATGWTAWYGTTSTLSRDTSNAKFGSASLKLVSTGTDGGSTSNPPWIGAYISAALSTNAQYAASVWVKPATTMSLRLHAQDAADDWEFLGAYTSAVAGQ